MKKDYAIFLPAGGLGSRLYPLTKDYPKAYLPIYFDKNNQIIRLIDLPLSFCRSNNIPLYITLDYKKEKLKYLEKYENVKIIYTEYHELVPVILEGLKQLEKDNIEYYSTYASDFLIPLDIVNEMINSINSETETVALCTKMDEYSKIKIKNNNGILSYTTGEDVIDLTFHVGSVKRGVSGFEQLATRREVDLWECLYPKENEEDLNKVMILLTDITHIDLGTPNPYYEALYKLNYKNIDSNNNIVFPGARINEASRNIIALPNSDSSAFILENCIIPENIGVHSYEDVLKVEESNKKYFKKMKIKEFI